MFAQTQSRLYLEDEVKIVQQPVIEDNLVLSTLDKLHVVTRADCAAGQTIQPEESCTYPGTNYEFEVDSSGRATPPVSPSPVPPGGIDTTIVYDSGQNDDQIFTSQAAGDIMAQRYEVPSGARLTSVSVAPVYNNQFNDSTVPDGSPRDFTLRIWDVTGDGLPGDELYSMDVDEASDASHLRRVNDVLTYSFLQVDLPANEEALATLPDRIFIGLANKGTDRNHLVFSPSRRESTAPDDAAYSYETINSETKWRPLANLSVGGQSLRDQVHPIRPRFLTSDTSPVPEETIVVYDSGQNDDDILIPGDAGNIMAQRYEAPSGARLASVMVAPVYDNQFRNTTVPAGSPRDFTLKIWDVAGDGSPGNELYSMDVDEANDASHLRRVNGVLTYSFLRVDLPANEEALAALPDRIFIGLANKGTDRNYLVFSPSRRESNAPDGAAYLYATINSNTQWYGLAGITYESDDGSTLSMRDQVFLIRPRFLTPRGPVSTDDPVELPSGVILAQNYPNPFNPTTAISWTQPVSGQVRLSVYNLLGQKMATLVDGLRPTGEHEVRLDASGWTSGVYVYVLETETHTLTRPMVLLK